MAKRARATNNQRPIRSIGKVALLLNASAQPATLPFLIPPRCRVGPVPLSQTPRRNKRLVLRPRKNPDAIKKLRITGLITVYS